MYLKDYNFSTPHEFLASNTYLLSFSMLKYTLYNLFNTNYLQVIKIILLLILLQLKCALNLHLICIKKVLDMVLMFTKTKKMQFLLFKKKLC